jgi:hypothetical protein
LNSVRSSGDQDNQLFAKILEAAKPARLVVRLCAKRQYDILREDRSNDLRMVVSRRMREIAETEPTAFLVDVNEDYGGGELELLRFWNACDPDAQRTWLEARLEKVPPDAVVVALFVKRLKEDQRQGRLSEDRVRSVVTPARLRRILETLDPAALDAYHRKRLGEIELKSL